MPCETLRMTLRLARHILKELPVPVTCRIH